MKADELVYTTAQIYFVEKDASGHLQNIKPQLEEMNAIWRVIYSSLYFTTNHEVTNLVPDPGIIPKLRDLESKEKSIHVDYGTQYQDENVHAITIYTFEPSVLMSVFAELGFLNVCLPTTNFFLTCEDPIWCGTQGSPLCF